MRDIKDRILMIIHTAAPQLSDLEKWKMTAAILELIVMLLSEYEEDNND